MGAGNEKPFKIDKEKTHSREEVGNLFEVMTNQDRAIIEYLKSNLTIIKQPLYFRYYVDTSVMIESLPVTCDCADDFELCIPRDDQCTSLSSVTCMVSKMAEFVKAGHCDHTCIREEEMEKSTKINDTSKATDFASGYGESDGNPQNDCGGIFPLHLAIIENKVQVIKELLPFCLNEDMFHSIWFTLKRRFSILHLALAHHRVTIVSEILKYVEKTNSESVLYFISFDDLYKAIETHYFDVFESLSRKFDLKESDPETIRRCYRTGYNSRSYKCLKYMCREFKNLKLPYQEVSENLEEAIKSADSDLLYVAIQMCLKHNWDEKLLKRHLHSHFLAALFSHNATAVATLVQCRSVILLNLDELRYRGYSFLGWAEELNLTDIVDILREAGGYRSRGTKHCAWSTISSVLLMENEHLVENVATLISKGHDVNKKHADYTYSPSNLTDIPSSTSVMIDETPFYVALKIGRYDVMGLLLLNGAEPLQEERFLYRLTEVNVRANVFFLLLSCNALKSVPAGGTSLLKFMIERTANVISTNVTPCFRDLVFLFLETCETLCPEDREFLSSGNVPPDIMNKYNQLLLEPLSLGDVCRRRLRRHFGNNYQLFINIVRDQGCPRRILDVLMYHDVIDKYFSTLNTARVPIAPPCEFC